MLQAAPLQAGDPRELSGYRLEGRLGEGAQGVVFLGRDRSGNQVAVKVLHARQAGDREARRRFLQELAAAKRVAGFGTAQVLDADVTGDRPYVVSEYVDGPSLQKLVVEQGPRSGGVLERLAVGTAMALAAIHHAGVVHRDFKPGNVLLGPDGPRVIDFGVSRALDSTATLTAGAVGTPAYMAPEQLGRGTVGPAADVFAWACTMVYAATGSPPFGNDTVAAVITRVLTAEPDLSGLSAPLAGVVAVCLAKDPTARPGIREVLDRVLGEPAGDAPESTPSVPPAPTATAVDTAPAAPPASAAAADPSAATVTRMLPPAPPPPAVVPTVPTGAVAESGGRRRRWLVPAGAVAVLAVLAGVGVWWLGGGSGQQKYTSLTDSGCRMVPAATVQKLVPEASVDRDGAGPENKATYFRAGCAWERTGDSSPIWRQLSIGVSVQLDLKDADLVDGAPTDGVRRAAADVTSTRHDFASKANRTHDLGGGYVMYYGPTTELRGIGDEAVVLSHHELAKDGAHYDPEVVEIDARLANAEIMVKYSSGANTGKRMLPTSEPAVRKQAETVARSLVNSLKNCTGCIR
ncbi:serine/threonine-protein kinase [Streptomyces violaceusniger]|uniref:Serine/threonine protein kinase n=1 Tax=Streptomyces violaceusniger (strain Tu 4113) TaxID=653045 RepID=G2P822_STRV4|nr:serine/threonine-protein kinase [Streptomyces violaceusniger]AEM85823.1 serine/threonine protein kinase [Streptomyces violaceusniger Tu 4113]